jgi:hypothetical protein
MQHLKASPTRYGKSFMPSLRHTLLPTVLVSALSFSVPLATIACKPPTQASISQPVGKFPVDRMSIGNIKMNMSDAQVERILGKPQQIKTESTRCCGTLKHWRYAILEVSFTVDDTSQKLSVYQITTKSPGVETLDHIRVGDRRSKVLRVYGNAGTSQNSDTVWYTNSQETRSFVFKFKGDRVIEIIASTLLN